jgi:hypothetical protein
MDYGYLSSVQAWTVIVLIRSNFTCVSSSPSTRDLPENWTLINPERWRALANAREPVAQFGGEHARTALTLAQIGGKLNLRSGVRWPITANG